MRPALSVLFVFGTLSSALPFFGRRLDARAPPQATYSVVPIFGDGDGDCSGCGSGAGGDGPAKTVTVEKTVMTPAPTTIVVKETPTTVTQRVTDVVDKTVVSIVPIYATKPAETII